MLARKPSTVPSPVVIALTELCRQAGRSPSEEATREALAQLPAEFDLEILRLCQHEPPFAPLSPLGVVDLVRGVSRERVEERERDGTYEGLALRLHREAQTPMESTAPEQEPSRAPRKRRKTKERLPPTPIRRPKAEVEARRLSQQAKARDEADEEPPEERPAVRPGRKPATPQLGRYVGGPVAKRPLSELLGPEGGPVLAELIEESHANRKHLLERLNLSWSGEDGREIDGRLLAKLLQRHGLEPLFARVERENLRRLLSRTGGLEAPLRRILGLPGDEIRRLIRRYDLGEEIRAHRERTRERVARLSTLEERMRWVLQERDKLQAARLLDELERDVRDELRDELERSRDEGGELAPDALGELTRRRLGLDDRMWRRAWRRLALDEIAERLSKARQDAPR